MDGQFREIESQLRRIRRDRVRLDQERQRLLEDQSKLLHCPDDQTPDCGDLDPRPIELRLHILERKYTRLRQQEADVRRRERDLTVDTPSSSSRSTGSGPRVRQSVLYSARRRPQGRQGRPVEEPTTEVSSSEPGHANTVLSQFKALTLNTMPPTVGSADRVEEHTAEVSSSEPRHTNTDLSQFEALTLNITPSTVESADRVVEHPTELRSSEPGHTITDLSQFEALTLNITSSTVESADRVVEHPTELRSSERGGTSVSLSKVEGLSLNVPGAESTDGAVVHAGDLDSRAPDSTNAKQPAVREGLSPRSQERWLRIDKYLAEHTFDDMWEGMVAMKNGFCNPPKKVPFPNKKSSKKLASPDSLESPHGLDAQPFQTTTQCGESMKQIIENGKQWMKKEVMEAFKKYMKETGRFRGVEFKLDELLYQCLSVETHEKIFHHYNFRVKTKQAGSDKWSSTLYFAQVKEVYGRKYYFCYPLDPFEEGFCHACKNQGMDALKHPAVPIGYETGQADTGCPFFDDDSDDDGDRVPDDDGMAWAFSQAYLGGVPY